MEIFALGLHIFPRDSLKGFYDWPLFQLTFLSFIVVLKPKTKNPQKYPNLLVHNVVFYCYIAVRSELKISSILVVIVTRIFHIIFFSCMGHVVNLWQDFVQTIPKEQKYMAIHSFKLPIQSIHSMILCNKKRTLKNMLQRNLTTIL